MRDLAEFLGTRFWRAVNFRVATTFSVASTSRALAEICLSQAYSP
jgi:hypothetical protein